MNRRSRRCCLLLAVLAGGLRADEKAGGNAAGSAPSGTAFDAATRDYEGITRARSSSELQKLDGAAPVQSNQNLSLGEPTSASAGSSSSHIPRAAKPAKSANWLLDAMTEPKLSPLDELRNGASPAAQSGEPRLSSAGGKAPDGVVNPLNSFMSSWMTPHDLEVLKAKGPDAGVGAAPDVSSNNFNLGDKNAASSPAPFTLGGTAQEGRPNPYLTDLSAASVEGAKSPLATPVFVAPAAPLPPLPVDLAPAKSPALPTDLQKAQDDSKYFPQLKRF